MKQAICIGCGEIRLVKAPRESIESYVKRRPYCGPCGHKNRIRTLGGHAPNWKGGKIKDKKGYMLVWVDGKYLKEHRYIYEQAYGEIPSGYDIHHINKKRDDNRLENLMCIEHKAHGELHGDTLRQHHFNNHLKRVEAL